METSPPPPATDAILTVPNLLTFFRLALVPLFLVVAFPLDSMLLALIIALLGFFTDIIDGKIARRFGQVSQLGIRLDPVSDRLGLAAGAVVLIGKHLAPLAIVVAVLVRDGLLLLVGAPLLRARGIPIPPVTRLGKYGSFAITTVFALYLASGINGAADPIEGARTAGLAVAIIAVPLYYASGIGYARAAFGRGARG